MKPNRIRLALVSMTILVICSILVPLLRETLRELAAPLFRDAAMMQYTGWCLRHGMRLYVDVGSPDGPVIHFLHAVMQMVGGIEDGATRRVDLALQIALAAGVGCLLAPPSSKTPGVRVLWSLLGVVAWLSWYLTSGWEHTVQRDAYYALLGYFSLVLLYASSRFGLARQRLALIVAGALLAWEPFTRQSGAIYPAMGALALLLDETNPISGWTRLRWLVSGAVLGLLVIAGALLVWGSFPGFVWWYFRFPLDAYRYIAARPFTYLFGWSYRSQQWLILSLVIASFALTHLRLLPRRAVVFSLTAFLFLVAACLMGKGWINHVQQVTAAGNVALLVLVSELWMRADAEPTWSGLRVGAVIVALAVLQIRCLVELSQSPFAAAITVYDVGERDAAMVGHALATDTRPDDRIFYFASEAHGLLDAERKTAIPYFVDTIFDIRDFLRNQPPSDEIEIPPEALDRFEKLQDEIAADGCGRLLADPPAAVVVRPNDLNTWSTDTVLGDIGGLCPDLPDLLEERYTQQTIAGYEVFLRNKRPP